MEIRIPTRKEQILQAALEVFSEKGYHKAKIEDIAQCAGIGKGTVYEYFSSKEQLFQAMLKEGVAQLNEALILELKNQDTIKGKLTTFVRKNVEMFVHHRPLARIAIMETAIIGDDFRRWLIEMHNDRIQLIEEIIIEGVKLGKIRTVNTKIAARLFYGGLGVLMSPFMDLDITSDNSQVLIDEVVGYFLQGINKES